MRLDQGISGVHFLIGFALAGLFLAGTWLLIRSLALFTQQERFPASIHALLGLALKMPMVAYIRWFWSSKSPQVSLGAIAGTCLVYFLAVAGAAFFTSRKR